MRTVDGRRKTSRRWNWYRDEADRRPRPALASIVFTSRVRLQSHTNHPDASYQDMPSGMPFQAKSRQRLQALALLNLKITRHP